MSGLDFQLVSIAFTQGMETRTDKKLVIPGKWNLLQNCTLSDGGDALSKRDGVAPMLASAVGNGLATFNRELLAIKGTNLSSISSPTLSPGTIAPTAVSMPGQVGFVEATKAEIDRGGGFVEGMDVAHGAGFTCYVWVQYTAAAYDGVYMALLDEATGARVIQKVQLNALGVRPRVVFSVNAFFIFYISPAAGTLVCRVVTITAGVAALGAAVALITSASLVNKNFDACEFGAGAVGSVGVSYVWAAVDSVRAIRVVQVAGVPSIATGPVSIVTQAEVADADIYGLGVCFITSQATFFATFIFAVVGAGIANGTLVNILNAAFAAAGVITQIDATVPAVATACHVVAVGQAAFPTAVCFTDQQSSIGAAAALVPLRRTEISFSAGVVTTILSTTLQNSAVCPTAGGPGVLGAPRGPFIVGKPIAAATWDSTGAGALVKGALLLPVAIVESHDATATNTKNLQPTIFLMDASSGVIVAKALYGNYGVGQLGAIPIVYTPSSTPLINLQSNANFSTWALAAGERGTLQFSDGLDTTQTGVVRLTFIPHTVTPPIDTQLGAATYLAGGSLSMYDAQGVTEVGFPLFPEGLMVVVGAGGALPLGTYQGVVVYEWVDGQGQRHQSAPSLPVSFTTTGGNQSVVFTAPTLLISQKTGVTVVLYVTQDAGTIFNRVTPMATPVLNTTAAVSVAFPALAGATSITGVAGNELLYTQPLQSGTTLPNDAPGPTSALGVHQNRLFVDQTDNPGAYRFSQALVQGVGLQFNATLGGTVPVDGGAIVGFADMDDVVLIFCERKIFRVTGTGPAPSGGFDNYSDPVEIPSDTGCENARSILKMPNGVVFKSEKGWHRVDRDLTVRYIGSAVFAYDAYDVFSSCYVEDRKEARFSCGFSFHYGTGNEIGATLVYSYLDDQWSISSIVVNDGVAPARTLLAYDAMWWAPLGVYMSISLADGLCRDTPGVFNDNLPAATTTPVIMTARTSFLHLPQLEGFQRVRWLYLTASLPAGTVQSAGLSIVVDYDDVYSAVTPPGATGTYTTTFAQASAVYGASGNIDFRHKLHRQKCKSVAFTFSNYQSTPASVFAVISGFEAFALEVGLKKGVNRLAATQTVP